MRPLAIIALLTAAGLLCGCSAGAPPIPRQAVLSETSQKLHEYAAEHQSLPPSEEANRMIQGWHPGEPVRIRTWPGQWRAVISYTDGSGCRLEANYRSEDYRFAGC